jgi:hypothetical protein
MVETAAVQNNAAATEQIVIAGLRIGSPLKLLRLERFGSTPMFNKLPFIKAGGKSIAVATSRSMVLGAKSASTVAQPSSIGEAVRSDQSKPK